MEELSPEYLANTQPNKPTVPEWFYEGSCIDGIEQEYHARYIDHANYISARNNKAFELEQQAKLICESCAVLEECREYALKTMDTSVHQVLGGLATRDVNRIRRKQGIKKSKAFRNRGKK